MPLTLDDKINKIHNMDCLEGMRQLPSRVINLVVTSPPYNISHKINNTGKWKNTDFGDGYDLHGDDMPEDKYIEWQQECIREMLRVIKYDGAIFYNHKHHITNGLREKKVYKIVDPFPVRQEIIWYKGHGQNFKKESFVAHYEKIFLICNPKFVLDGEKSIRNGGDVWHIPNINKNPHPAPFPEELARRAIASTSAQIIMDPFSGSGTTAVVAKKLGRDYIGFELSPEYVAMSQRRLETLDAIQAILF